MKRMISASVRPPKNAAIAPSEAPSTNAIDARDEAHLQRNTQAVEDSRPHVAALRICAEPMREAVRADEARRAARIAEHEIGEVVRVLRRDQRRQQSDRDDGEHDGERRHRHTGSRESRARSVAKPSLMRSS